MSYVKNLDINGTSYEIKSVAANNVNDGSGIKTWVGTKAQYDAITTKDSNTLYNITDDTDVTIPLLELLYPVGAVYIGTMSVCPLSVLGVGTWQLVASDRVLQGTGTNSVGTTIEAGLPNITGYLAPSWSNQNNAPTSGAFYTDETTSNQIVNVYSQGNKTFKFDASRSSSIYGNSSTVQPPAYIVNIWERIS